MDDPQRSYHEGLLHWIWKNKHLTYQSLRTTGGEKVSIHFTGRHNKTDGPDFKAAEITIGNLRWYGDVEIHWKISDWDAHGHTSDVNYNNVILHVVFEETDQTIARTDHSRIPTLCLSSSLSDSLHSFLEQYRTQPRLPCAGHLSFIPKEVFARQLAKAHKEYFEQKVDATLGFYDPSLPPSLGWKKMFITALFDGLGISYNRMPMQTLAVRLWDVLENCPTVEELQRQALLISKISSTHPAPSEFAWRHKGSRPGNHPLPRIKQGAACLWYIFHLPFEQWMHQDPTIIWKSLIASISAKPSIGRERSMILFGTVFLPALFILGNLLFSEKLKSKIWALWQSHKVSLPSSLTKSFDDTPLLAGLYKQKLGTVYQLRAYCRPKQCQGCEVFKNIIST